MRKKENNPGCGGCGCIFSILFYIILYEYFEIKSHKLYDWYSGIGHGFLIIPNFIIHTIFDDHWLYKAKQFTNGYNIGFYISSIIAITICAFRTIYTILILAGIIKHKENNITCEKEKTTISSECEEEHEKVPDFFDKPIIANNKTKKELKKEDFDFFEEQKTKKERRNKEEQKKEHDFFDEPFQKKEVLSQNNEVKCHKNTK